MPFDPLLAVLLTIIILVVVGVGVFNYQMVVSEKREIAQKREFLSRLPEPPRGLKWTYHDTFPVSRLGLQQADDHEPIIELEVLASSINERVARLSKEDYFVGINRPLRVTAYNDPDPILTYAGPLLLDFAYATGAFEHLPTWVGPEKNLSFTVTVPTNGPRVTPRVQIGKQRLAPRHMRPLSVDTRIEEPLDLALILAIWPAWAEAHMDFLAKDVVAQKARKLRHANYMAEERLRMTLERIARTPQENIDDQFAELEGESGSKNNNIRDSYRAAIDKASNLQIREFLNRIHPASRR